MASPRLPIAPSRLAVAKVSSCDVDSRIVLDDAFEMLLLKVGAGVGSFSELVAVDAPGSPGEEVSSLAFFNILPSSEVAVVLALGDEEDDGTTPGRSDVALWIRSLFSDDDDDADNDGILFLWLGASWPSLSSPANTLEDEATAAADEDDDSDDDSLGKGVCAVDGQTEDFLWKSFSLRRFLR